MYFCQTRNDIQKQIIKKFHLKTLFLSNNYTLHGLKQKHYRDKKCPIVKLFFNNVALILYALFKSWLSKLNLWQISNRRSYTFLLLFFFFFLNNKKVTNQPLLVSSLLLCYHGHHHVTLVTLPVYLDLLKCNLQYFTFTAVNFTTYWARS